MDNNPIQPAPGSQPQGQPMQPTANQVPQPQPITSAPSPFPNQAVQQAMPQQQPAMAQGQPMAQPAPQQTRQPMQGQPMQQMPQGQPYRPNYSQAQGYAGQPQGQMPNQMPGQPGGPQQPGFRPGARPALTGPGGPNPRRLILGCLGFFFFSIILFVIFVIAFVANTSASGQNGLADSLGVNAGEFTNTLILITNLIFGLVVMVTFFIAIFGLFRAGMAPKLDKPTRSKGYRQAGIAGVIFLIMTMLWVFVYIYLNGKKANIPTQQATTQGIVTEPVVTTQLTAPIDIKFDATKIPYNPNQIEITFYEWDFGDGGTSNSPVVTHTYSDVGQYSVKLTVTARNKATSAIVAQNFEKLVTVTDVKINAVFSATPESGPAPLTVAFDASASSSPAGELKTYEWDFKGTATFRDATGSTTSFTFDKQGDYDVKLRVTDNSGQSAVVTKTITAGGPDIPVSVIDIPTTDGKYYVGKQLTFLGEQSTSPNGNITKYEWDFGDQTPKATTRTATHTYAKTGLYEVILKTTDEAGKIGTGSKKITLTNAESTPQAIIDTTPALGAKDKTLNGTVPFQVHFDASKSTDSDNNIVEFKWDFEGDGAVDSAGATADYVYKTAGSYNATLTAIDAAGNQSSELLVVIVASQGLQARLTADVVEGTAPLTVKLDASSSSYPDGQITSYEWDFGDGSPKRIDASQVSYKYTNIGTFTASVIAKASDGKTSKGEIIINVRPVALKACYTPSTEQGPAPLSVEFDPRCSEGAVAKYLWDFGDGQTSRIRKPTHTFDNAGSYQVTLEVTDNENVVNTYKKDILVTGTVQ